MIPSITSTKLLRRSRIALGTAVLLILAVFCGTVFLAWQQLRHQIRTQIAGGTAELLYNLAINNNMDHSTALSDKPADQISAILEASALPPFSGLIATRLFDRHGELVTMFPEYVSDADILPEDMRRIESFQPVSRFHPEADLSSHFWFDPETESRVSTQEPLIEIIIPLHARGSDQLLGAAQFIMNGRNIAALDKTLATRALGAALMGSALILASLGFAFRRLQRTNRLLAERTERLLRANQELALAAKSSAVGSVAAHLIHGLKNPLFGLQNFVTERGTQASTDTEWEVAASSARRMQSLVSDVVRVLREESETSQYELSLDELAALVTSKVKPVADQARVQFLTDVSASGSLTNRDSNLVTLILENLLQNAIQASAPSGTVRLLIRPDGEGVSCDVTDRGSGVPEHLTNHLFSPCNSSKQGGNGIGLAISKQLANSLEARLLLSENGPDGATFSLKLPGSLFHLSASAERGSCPSVSS